MVTRILFDPRRDLPDGSTISIPVIVQATPTGVREDGSVVIVPSTISFTVNTGADVVQLAPATAPWAWRIVVRNSVTDVVLQQRTVKVPDQLSVEYQDLIDVDPASLEVTPGTTRAWDATFGQIMGLLANAGLGPGNGSTGTEYPQTGAASTWGPILHGLGRRPSVTVYDSNGDQIAPDVHATTTTVSLVFATPVAGTAVLT